jgi:anti-anti-sigma factor
MKTVEYRRINDIIILQLDSDLNACMVMNLQGIMEEIMDKNILTIAVDCTRLFVLDPVTISQVAACMKKARDNKIELIFYNINPEVQLTFEMMKLNGFFNLMSREKFEKDYIDQTLVN